MSKQRAIKKGLEEGAKSAERKTLFNEELESRKRLDVDEFSDGDEVSKILPEIKDNWNQGMWHDFIDNEDDDEYYQKHYKTGEV